MKIIIISYYFPPCNSIASLRPLSWAKEWVKLGHEVTVITRGWESTDNNWDKFISSSINEKINCKYNSGYKVIEIPFTAYKYIENNLLRKLNSLYRLIVGDFNYEIDVNQFYDGIKEEIGLNKPDVIIVSTPPLGLVKLGYKLTKKFNIKLVVDFRDYENYSILNQSPVLSLFGKMDLFFKNLYLKKWLSAANFVSVASKEFANYFLKNGIYDNALEFTNGFETELFNSLKSVQSNKFTISIIGSILKEQDVSIFLNGFNDFLSKCDCKKVEVNFIGGMNIPEMAEIWKKSIPITLLNVTERIDRKDALEIGKKSTLLFYAGWKNYRGMYSGKIFDYLALNRPILIAPSDNDVIENLVLKTQSGKVANTSNEISSILFEWYSEWDKNGFVKYDGDSKDIINYSREKIANKLIESIEEKMFR